MLWIEIIRRQLSSTILSHRGKDMSLECVYLAIENISNSDCIEFESRLGDIILQMLRYCDHRLIGHNLHILELIIHTSIGLVLYSSDGCLSPMVYWLNPLTLMSLVLDPPLHAILALRIMILLLAIRHRWLMITTISFSSLVLSKPAFIAVFPFIQAIMRGPSPSERKKQRWSIFDNILIVTMITLVLMYIAVSIRTAVETSDSIVIDIVLWLHHHVSRFNKSVITSYEPNALGVWWYLRAQVFDDFTPYILFLLWFQPFLFVYGLYYSLTPLYPSAAVS
jgi:hypothetical protein